MSHEFVSGADVLVMDDRDHVATLLRDMQAGENIHSSRTPRIQH